MCFWQLVKSQMKCPIMQYFIRVYTVCSDKKLSSEKEMQFYLEPLTCDPSNYTIDHPMCIVSNRRKNPFRHKGLMIGRVWGHILYLKQPLVELKVTSFL